MNAAFSAASAHDGLCLMLKSPSSPDFYLRQAAAALSKRFSLAISHRPQEAWQQWNTRTPAGFTPKFVVAESQLFDDNGIDWIRRQKEVSPDSISVLVEAPDEQAVLFAALAAGADAYLPKGEPPERLGMLLRHLVRGETALTASAALRLLAHFRTPKTHHCPDDLLSIAERQTLTLLARGLPPTRVAQEQGLDTDIITTQVRAVCRKLGVSNSTFR